MYIYNYIYSRLYTYIPVRKLTEMEWSLKRWTTRSSILFLRGEEVPRSEPAVQPAVPHSRQLPWRKPSGCFSPSHMPGTSCRNQIFHANPLASAISSWFSRFVAKSEGKKDDSSSAQEKQMQRCGGKRHSYRAERKEQTQRGQGYFRILLRIVSSNFAGRSIDLFNPPWCVSKVHLHLCTLDFLRMSLWIMSLSLICRFSF